MNQKIRIIKRNGEEVTFNIEKIINAISKANNEVIEKDKISKEIINEIAKEIESLCFSSTHTMNVEEIQDLVETKLMKNNAYEIAKRYIRYRYEHELKRTKNTTDDNVLSLVENNNEEIKQENSNKNPTVISVQRDYIAGEVSKDISKRYLLSKDIIDANDSGIIHFHDLDYFVTHGFNCDLVNLEDMLMNGTVISGTKIDKPKSFSTACNIATQIIAQVASSQYGGQSISLAHLVPFVDISRQKIRDEVKKEIEGITINSNNSPFKSNEEFIESVVKTRLAKEIEKGIQTIQYQVVTLMTTNGQAPFVTLFMYLDEVEEGQPRDDLAMIIEEVLKQRYLGTKNEKGVYVTPAFPKLIYVLDEDNIHEDSKYYYLTKLAAKCTARRMVPDYISAKVQKELKQGNVYPCMGCVDGESVVKIRHNNEEIELSFYKLWDKFAKIYEVKHQYSDDNPNVYIDVENVEIYDTLKGFVKLQRIIRNITNDWLEISFSNNTILKCTSDHPFDIIDKGRVLAKDLEVHKDATYCHNSGNVVIVSNIKKLRKSSYSYDVTTESDHFQVNGIYSHNCRSFLTVEDNIRNEDGTHKFYGRFNQGVVTINLVDVALSSEKNVDKFWKIYDERLELCHKALQYRHNRLEGTTSDVAPILWQYGAIARLNKGEKIDKYLHNGYSTISLGYAGLAECVYYMTGKPHTNPEASPFALEVMQKLNDVCEKWKKEENISYSVYGTPLESTTYKFAKCLQKRFGIIENVTDKNYITNSYHIKVTEEIDAFKKISFESQFQKLSPGGAISYVEVPNLEDNPEAILEIMRHIYDNIIYAEINTKSDYCQVCGYTGEIQIIEDESHKLIWECPNCKNRDQDKMNVARRTCGYIGSNWWNQGRTQEIKERYVHGDNHDIDLEI